MPLNRFFVEAPLIVGSHITLDKKEAHHLRVLRKKKGATVELINGEGILAHAEVGETLHITKVEEGAPPPPIILCQAIPRLNRLDTILEKCTEIGMQEVWLFPGERSEKKELTKNQLERTKHMLKAALKQCGRLHLPKLSLKPPIKKWDKLPGLTLYGDLKGKATFPQKLDPPIHFIIGPEAGFSPKEEEKLHTLGQGVHLNDAILRTDTAPLTALSILNYILLT